MHRFRWLILLFGAIWIVQGVNLATGYGLNRWFGLQPRSFGGLDGILFMPVLHGSIAHAASNSFPLIVLGGLMAATSRLVFDVSAVIIILGGLGVWIFGKTALHVGASGLIFGWFGYLVARGLVEKRLVPVLAAAVVVVLYSSMIWGIFPGQLGVSWEAHFFGAAAGVVAAFALRTSRSGSGAG